MFRVLEELEGVTLEHYDVALPINRSRILIVVAHKYYLGIQIEEMSTKGREVSHQQES